MYFFIIVFELCPIVSWFILELEACFLGVQTLWKVLPFFYIFKQVLDLTISFLESAWIGQFWPPSQTELTMLILGISVGHFGAPVPTQKKSYFYLFLTLNSPFNW